MDGTLLPMDLAVFIKTYFSMLLRYLASHGYQVEKASDALQKGIAAMMGNDGTKTNESAFWQAFKGTYGALSEDDIAFFEEFYHTEFQKLRDICGYDPRAAQCVCAAKDIAEKVILATNPLFPRTATEQRVGWSGCAATDFDYSTTFENASYSKPSLAYYQQILDRMGLLPDECLMVGNDVEDDMVAAELGIRVFLLTPYLINKNNKPIDAFPHGDFDSLLRFLSSMR